MGGSTDTPCPQLSVPFAIHYANANGWLKLQQEAGRQGSREANAFSDVVQFPGFLVRAPTLDSPAAAAAKITSHPSPRLHWLSCNSLFTGRFLGQGGVPKEAKSATSWL